MRKNKIGLAIGYLFALIHLIWALAVWIMPAQLQSCLDWIFNIHGIKPIWVITSISFFDAIMLIIVTFIIGYIIGWILAWFLQLVNKNNKN